MLSIIFFLTVMYLQGRILCLTWICVGVTTLLVSRLIYIIHDCMKIITANPAKLCYSSFLNFNFITPIGTNYICRYFQF